MKKILLNKSHWLGLFFALTAIRATAQVSLPTARMVFQRGQDNATYIPIQGYCPTGTIRIEASASAINGGNGRGWTPVVDPVSGTGFSGRLRLDGGWYSLSVRAVGAGGILATWTVDRVGVGEVFIVSGHSVAAGHDTHPIVASTEDRVNAITRPLDRASRDHYDRSPTPDNLPKTWVQYGEIRPAPYGDVPYFWSKCAERLVQRLNVPVAMYQTSAGGTNLEQWWKSSQGIQFEHGFVNSAIRLPYINLKNALTVYSAQTGVRSLLCDHGANDLANPNAWQIADYYKGMLNQARADFGFPVWALINRATPGINEGGPYWAVRQAQEAAAAHIHCAPGPDYDSQLAPQDRYDNIHMALSGMQKAAVIWADAVTDSFLQRATPFQPTWPEGVATVAPAIPAAPVVVAPVVVAPTPTPTPGTPAGANLKGHLDVANCQTIGGWAANLSNPGQPLSVDIYINGQKVNTILANNERNDVAAAYNITPNRFGFTWFYPNQYKTGQPLTVTVRYAGTSTELFSAPRSTGTCEAVAQTPVVAPAPTPVVTPTPAPTPVVVAPVVTPTPTPTPGTPAGANLKGHLDVANCQTIGGWAANLSNPGQPLSVDIYINGQKATTLLANNERNDVAAAYNITPNRFGFTWFFPSQYKTGQPLTVTVRYAGTSTELFSAPRSTGTCLAGARVSTGLEEQKLVDKSLQQVLVYPNPATHEISVKNLSASVASYHFVWINLLGQRTALSPMPSSETNEARFYIGEQPSGLYVLQILGEGKRPISIPVLKR